MPNKEFILDTLKKLHFKYQKQGIDIIGIFGSIATDESNAKSDIDILYEPSSDIINLYKKKLSLKNELKNIFHTNIDLVNKKYLKSYAKDEIMGDLIYVK